MRPSSDTPTHWCCTRTLRGWVESRTRTARRRLRLRKRAAKFPAWGPRTRTISSGPCRYARPLTRREVEEGYEENTGQVIVERFAELDPLAMPAVLVAGHAPFTWGRTAAESGGERRGAGSGGRHGPGHLVAATPRPPSWSRMCWRNTISANMEPTHITDNSDRRDALATGPRHSFFSSPPATAGRPISEFR